MKEAVSRLHGTTSQKIDIFCNTIALFNLLKQALHRKTPNLTENTISISSFHTMCRIRENCFLRFGLPLKRGLYAMDMDKSVSKFTG